MQLINLISFSFLCLGCVFPALGKGKDDFQQETHIRANRQEVTLADNTLTFWENVEIQQGSIRILADKVIIRHNKNNNSQWLEAFGTPATFSQVLDDDKPLFAHAQVIRYNTQSKSIYLEHKAFVKQQDSQVSGENIHYDAANGKIEAHSKNTAERVKSVFSFKTKNEP